MILYRTQSGWIVEILNTYYPVAEKTLAALLARSDLHDYLASCQGNAPIETKNLPVFEAPIDDQQVWASGVTYYRSRSARMEESKNAGGGNFYDRVYSADRPELFFKAIGRKVAGPNSAVRIRSDAKWSVPEPELTLVVDPRGEIAGFTIGNDMSSRDIEGANPLYLPQAKVYDQSCALGPGILIQKEPMPPDTQICMGILRGGESIFFACIHLSEMKRRPQTLVDYLFRDQTFPEGCFLLTGTGIIPPDNFTLHSGDEIRISIGNIGTLVNHVD